MELTDQIKKIIHESVADATVHIHDPDSKHLEAIVISDAFIGLSLLQRSRNIMKALHHMRLSPRPLDMQPGCRMNHLRQQVKQRL